MKPRLARLGHLALKTASTGAKTAAQRRAGVVAVCARLLWWGAVAVLVLAGRELFGGPAAGHAETRALFLAGAGLLASCFVLVALERRLRWAAFGLGLGHASVAMLAWAALLD